MSSARKEWMSRAPANQTKKKRAPQAVVVVFSMERGAGPVADEGAARARARARAKYTEQKFFKASIL